jgi:hypothetical protein
MIHTQNSLRNRKSNTPLPFPLLERDLQSFKNMPLFDTLVQLITAEIDHEVNKELQIPDLRAK